LPASSRYAERDAPPALRDRLRCSWRFRQAAGEAQPTQVLPDGCVDLIWDGRALFVAGPDHCASSAALAPGSVLSGVRLAAGAGACVLGVPLQLGVPIEPRVPLVGPATIENVRAFPSGSLALSAIVFAVSSGVDTACAAAVGGRFFWIV
jgi:hypothetical protein